MAPTSFARASTSARVLLWTTLLASHVSFSHSFIRPENFGTSRPYHHSNFKSTFSENCQDASSTSSSKTDSASSSAITYSPVFDFTKNTTVESFERIDDAIMGGISTSSLKNVHGEPYASWSGVCRLDGGGFCGMRTLAFQEPLKVGDADGFYLDCRLTSDDEPERRVWKMTTRSERSRGEELYQAQFTLPSSTNTTTNEWTRVKIPFSSFRLVRGPRMVQDGAPLNVTGGLYQIGLSLSKFQIATNTTELPNFRPGFFELQLRTIGLYSDVVTSLQVTEPSTLTPEEARRKRPLIVKMLLPVLSLLFSEESRRRKSAMKILMEQRGLSRRQAIMFGIRQRAQSVGMVRSLLSYAGIALADSLRTVVRLAISYLIFGPIRLVLLLPTLPAKWLSPKRKSGTTGASTYS